MNLKALSLEDRGEGGGEGAGRPKVLEAKLVRRDVGYGDERPIDTNATDEGRKANRRVELHATEVVEQAEKKP